VPRLKLETERLREIERRRKVEVEEARKRWREDIFS
jgi:hypothetical protein